MGIGRTGFAGRLAAGAAVAWAIGAGTPARAQVAPQAPAPAAPANTPDPALEAIVKDLGARDLKTRMNASDLIGSGTYALRDLEAVLRGDQLNPEQRQRLLNVAHMRFEAEPRAAMGIQFLGNDQRDVLVDPKAGFHSAEVLRARDRIVQADGVAIDERPTLIKVIISHDPGDSIPVVVERAGAPVNVKVRLGSYASLGQPPQYELIRNLAWQFRSREYAEPAGAKAAPIESGLTAAAWALPAPSDDDADLVGQRGGLGDQDPARTALVAGGEARDGQVPDRGASVIIRGSGALRPGVIMVQPVPLIQDLQQTIQTDTQRQMVNLKQINDAGTPEQLKATLRVENERLQKEIDLCNEQLRKQLRKQLMR